MSAARRALVGEIEARVAAIQTAEDRAFTLTDQGRLTWNGAVIGRLTSGPTRLAPLVDPIDSDLLSPAMRDRIRRRLMRFVQGQIDSVLGQVMALKQAELSGPARGIAFQIVEALGAVPCAVIADQLDLLSAADRRVLSKLGCRFGTQSVYLSAVLNRKPQRLTGLLHAVHVGLRPIPAVPKAKSFGVLPGVPLDWYLVIGCRVIGGRAYRLDLLETLAQAARRLAREAPFAPPPELLVLAGCTETEIAPVLTELGYRARSREGGTVYTPRRGAPEKPAIAVVAVSRNSPFADLRARMQSARRAVGD